MNLPLKFHLLQLGDDLAGLLQEAIWTAGDVSHVPDLRFHSKCSSLHYYTGLLLVVVGAPLVLLPVMLYRDAVEAWMFVPSAICGLLLVACGAALLYKLFVLEVQYQRQSHYHLTQLLSTGVLAESLAAVNLSISVVFDHDDAANRVLWDAYPGNDIPGPLILFKSARLRSAPSTSKLEAEGAVFVSPRGSACHSGWVVEQPASTRSHRSHHRGERSRRTPRARPASAAIEIAPLTAGSPTTNPHTPSHSAKRGSTASMGEKRNNELASPTASVASNPHLPYQHLDGVGSVDSEQKGIPPLPGSVHLNVHADGNGDAGDSPILNTRTGSPDAT